MSDITTKGNLLTLLNTLQGNQEQFCDMVRSGKSRIEAIVSNGQATPEGSWYDQDQDEWVVLLQGSAVLRFDNGKEIALEAGDYLLIPAHCRHRVESTTSLPNCLWLAVHGELEPVGS